MFELVIYLLNKIPRQMKSKIIFATDLIAYFTLIYFVTLHLVLEIPFNHILFVVVWTLIAMIFAGFYKIPLRFQDINKILQLISISLIISLASISLNNYFWDESFSVRYVSLAVYASLLFVFYKTLCIVILKKIEAISSEKALAFCSANRMETFISQLKLMAGVKVSRLILDDDLPIREIAGIRCISIDEVENVINSLKIKKILIAPSLNSSVRYGSLLSIASKLNISIRVVSDNNAFSVRSSKLDHNTVNYLLGRKSLDLKGVKEYAYLENKVVLITGAGGSIGSELSLHVADSNPALLILLDNNEYNLFRILEKLKKNGHDGKIKSYIGDISADIRHVFADNNIDIVLHAAALKHVPIVENNICEAVHTNVLGTHNLVTLAKKYDVSKFLLVSTDKAVRPTNVMGATKRIAEFICQVAGTEQFSTSIVRFGNVLGSSGSVLPTFLEQLESGGPITVTHPEITRYFMTIPEAANLILRSQSMSINRAIFLLDMGNPVKILDFAKAFIRLHGYIPTLEDEDSDGGDHIRIRFSGLRPGEKLYEELLVNNEALPTPHEKIFIANDRQISELDLKRYLAELEKALQSYDHLKIISVLQEMPLGYASDPANMKTQDNYETKDIIETAVTTKVIESSPPKSKIGLNGLTLAFFSRIYHVYFLLSRATTMGVRAIIFNQKKQVMLVKHSYENKWYLPGGGVETGESLERSLQREVYEETQLVSNGVPRLVAIEHNKQISIRDFVVFYEYPAIKKGVSEKTSYEISKKGYFALDDLPVNIDYLSFKIISQYYGD